MKIVIQCAATKDPSALSFQTSGGAPVKFVANPLLAPRDGRHSYARPDDLQADGETWRQRLLRYNEQPGNREGLLPAYRLYRNPVYAGLVRKFGAERVFILSAGWGLIPANFLTPAYDITFSGARNVPLHCRRKKTERYADFCLLSDDGDEINFVGGKDYLPLFCKLTSHLKASKRVFFNSTVAPALSHGFIAQRFPVSQRTNWHYACADALIEGHLGRGQG